MAETRNKNLIVIFKVLYNQFQYNNAITIKH